LDKELPQTLQDGENFGKGQKFLDFPCCTKWVEFCLYLTVSKLTSYIQTFSSQHHKAIKLAVPISWAIIMF
jgi:hypothetical protein